MARRTKADIEQQWYDVFVRWRKPDREAAIRALTTLNRALPDVPQKAAPAQPTLLGNA